MFSRAKFSFGRPAMFWFSSSQIIIAGSRAIARSRASNAPRPDVRSNSFCRSINAALRTFDIAVAKCPCQKNVNFSGNGFVAITIRSSHQRVSARPSVVTRAWYALRCAAVPFLPGAGATVSCGGGVESTPWSDADGGRTSAATVAAYPALTAASSSAGVAPNPARRYRCARSLRKASEPLLIHRVCRRNVWSVSTSRNCRVRGSIPQFVQPVVVDPEVMGNLVDDGLAHLGDDLLLGVAIGTQAGAVDHDPVGQDPGVGRRPLGQRHADVEPEQVWIGRHVLDEDRHVAHRLRELLRNAIQGLGDELFEALARDLHHPASKPRGRPLCLTSPRRMTPGLWLGDTHLATVPIV